MPFNLVPSPKSMLGLAMAMKALLLQFVEGQSEDNSETELNQVPSNMTEFILSQLVRSRQSRQTSQQFRVYASQVAPQTRETLQIVDQSLCYSYVCLATAATVLKNTVI